MSQELARHAGKQVAVSQIAAQVNAMWKEAATQQGPLPPVMRACVLNLIAYIDQPDQLAAVNDTFGNIVGRHPSRLILTLGKQEGGKPGIEAFVSAVCQQPEPGGRQVCCEEITLVERGTAAAELLSAVLSNLAADVPVVLWWRAEPDCNASLFQKMTGVADYIILDSAFFQDPIVRWRELRARFPAAAFADMNWARISPWRELIAQFFDSPEALALLYRLTRIRLEYSAHGAMRLPTQALLGVAWLATRLDWEIVSAREVRQGEYDLELRRGKDPVRVEIRALEAGYARTGRLISCALECEGVEGGAEFVVRREVKEDLLHTRKRVASQLAVDGATSFEIRQEHALLNVELGRIGRHPLFDAALDWLVRVDTEGRAGGKDKGTLD